jgi:hypothetical protein
MNIELRSSPSLKNENGNELELIGATARSRNSRADSFPFQNTPFAEISFKVETVFEFNTQGSSCLATLG